MKTVSPKRAARGLSAVVSCVFSLLAHPWATAQEQPKGKISVKVEMVNILCSVLDKKGNFVTNLAADDFLIAEDGVPQKIENFSARGQLPLSVSLLVDTSASVAQKIKFEQDAAAEFLSSVIHAPDKALLAEFDTGVTLIQDFSNDPNLLIRQLRTIKAAGGTSLYDALYLVSEEKLVWDSDERRKTIVMISDGEDTVSKVTFQDALEMVQKAGAALFAISTNRTGHFNAVEAETGDDVLEQLASATGGKVFYPSRIEDLGAVFKEIEQEIRSQYSLSYRSNRPSRDGKFHAIRVTARDKSFHVRHRKGYFSPKADVLY